MSRERRVSHLGWAFAAALLAACDEAPKVSCPGEDVPFFRASIGYYFANHDKGALDRYVLRDGARYDTTNDWWIVPFDLDGQKLQALLSCDGHLEITGR